MAACCHRIKAVQVVEGWHMARGACSSQTRQFCGSFQLRKLLGRVQKGRCEGLCTLFCAGSTQKSSAAMGEIPVWAGSRDYSQAGHASIGCGQEAIPGKTSRMLYTSHIVQPGAHGGLGLCKQAHDAHLLCISQTRPSKVSSLPVIHTPEQCCVHAGGRLGKIGEVRSQGAA